MCFVGLTSVKPHDAGKKDLQTWKTVMALGQNHASHVQNIRLAVVPGVSRTPLAISPASTDLKVSAALAFPGRRVEGRGAALHWVRLPNITELHWKSVSHWPECSSTSCGRVLFDFSPICWKKQPENLPHRRLKCQDQAEAFLFVHPVFPPWTLLLLSLPVQISQAARQRKVLRFRCTACGSSSR